MAGYVRVTEMKDTGLTEEAVNNRVAGAAIIIPANFTREINRGRKDAVIQIIQDPTLTIGPMVVKNIVGMYLDGINGFRIMIQLITDNIQVTNKTVTSDTVMNAISDYKDWYKDYQDTLFHTTDALRIVAPENYSSKSASNEENTSGMVKMMGIVLSGQMLFFAFQTAANSMASILREQDHGTLARLFSTPTPRTAILTGKFMAVFLIVLIQSVVMLLIGAMAFKINWGQPLNILLLTTGQVISAGGLGVFLISFVKTSKQTGPVVGAGLTLLGMLSGLFTPTMQMPEAMQILALMTPQGWAIKGWQLSLNGANPLEISLYFVVLLIIGLALFFIGANRFKKRFN
jgi:ABC-type multidrug transport system permease subunit